MDAALLQKYQGIVVQCTIEFGVKILAAIAFWVIGRLLNGKFSGQDAADDFHVACT